jgi:hypothetical protein
MSTRASPDSRREIASCCWWCVSLGLRPMTNPRSWARSRPSLGLLEGQRLALSSVIRSAPIRLRMTARKTHTAASISAPKSTK